MVLLLVVLLLETHKIGFGNLSQFECYGTIKWLSVFATAAIILQQ